MKKLISFSLYPGTSFLGASYSLDERTFAICKEKWPDKYSRIKNAFIVEDLDSESEELREIFSCIEQNAGKRPNFESGKLPSNDPDFIRIKGRRVFEEEDIRRAHYFQCFPSDILAHDVSRDEHGLMHFKLKDLRKKKFGRTNSKLAVLCVDGIRQEMEECSFNGISFLDVHIKNAKEDTTVVWEVSAKNCMPAICNPLKTDRGEIGTDEQLGCYVESFYFPPKIKYEAGVLDQINGADLMISQERFGGGISSRRTPFLFCSRRFKAWCDDRGFNIKWNPIFFD